MVWSESLSFSISERAKVFLEQLEEEYQDEPEVQDILEYIRETVYKYEDLSNS